MSLPSERWMDVRRRMDDLEARLRRGRFTVPTYLAATLFFLASGFFTGTWGPAAALAGLCLMAAWVTHRIRRTRLGQLRALEELAASVPDEDAGDARPGEAPESDRGGDDEPSDP